MEMAIPSADHDVLFTKLCFHGVKTRGLRVAITARGVRWNKCLDLLDIYCWQHSCVKSIMKNEIGPYSQWKGTVNLR